MFVFVRYCTTWFITRKVPYSYDISSCAFHEYTAIPRINVKVYGSLSKTAALLSTQYALKRFYYDVLLGINDGWKLTVFLASIKINADIIFHNWTHHTEVGLCIYVSVN